ncbi:MAG: hypothetical protein ACK4WC_04535, partial [Rubrimonas sp.]
MPGADGPAGRPGPRHPAMVDGAPDERLSALARAAAAAMGARIAMIKLTDGTAWLTRGLHGLDAPLQDHSFCKLTLQGDGPTVVPDAAAHPELSMAPAHRGPPRLRFYAGLTVDQAAEALGMGARQGRCEGLFDLGAVGVGVGVATFGADAV